MLADSRKDRTIVTNYLRNLRLFNRDVRVYLLAVGLEQLTRYGIQQLLLNLYLLRLGFDPEFMGLVRTVGGLATTAICLPAGALAMRYGTRRILVVGIILMAAGFGLLPLVEATPTGWWAGWVLATNLLASLGVGFSMVCGLPFLMNATGTTERNYAFSMHAALGLLTGMVGTMIASGLPGLFASALGVTLDHPAPYRYPLLISALLLVPAVPALLSTREFSVQRPEERRARSGRAPYGLLVFIVAFMVLRYSGETAAATFFNVYLDDALQTPTPLIGGVIAVSQLVSAVTALAIPLMMARWDNRLVIITGTAGVALGMGALALIPHWAGAGLAMVAVSAFSWSAIVPFRVYSQQIVSPGWRPAMSGAMMLGRGFSMSAAALGGGYVITHLGYPTLFWIGALMAAIGAPVIWAFSRARRGEPSQHAAADAADTVGR